MSKNNETKHTIDSSDLPDDEEGGLLHKPAVSGSAIDFYTDLMQLINAYCKEGLKKPDLVEKMKYATKSCEMS